eukprot:Phypoly_transcript_18341.p1 GENE.Phypoly_transcript_18341~~Phypoly_transcript_18341.p1  ORF type:complete len:236 (+),score=21.76 Phypoly_transcript_18341:2-709(+)
MERKNKPIKPKKKLQTHVGKNITKSFVCKTKVKANGRTITFHKCIFYFFALFCFLQLYLLTLKSQWLLAITYSSGLEKILLNTIVSKILMLYFVVMKAIFFFLLSSLMVTCSYGVQSIFSTNWPCNLHWAAVDSYLPVSVYSKDPCTPTIVYEGKVTTFEFVAIVKMGWPYDLNMWNGTVTHFQNGDYMLEMQGIDDQGHVIDCNTESGTKDQQVTSYCKWSFDSNNCSFTFQMK